MTKTLRDNDITERLREWMDDRYASRGRYGHLERDSGIPAQRWKDMYYRRQFATDEMLAFVDAMSPADLIWLKTGVRPPKTEGFPFLTSPPTAEDKRSLTTRLIWVIKEWASPRGADLFKYLENQSQSKVLADEWASVLLGRSAANADMIELVCSERPHFASWIVGASVDARQVDPTDSASIERWEQASVEAFNQMLGPGNQDLNK